MLLGFEVSAALYRMVYDHSHGLFLVTIGNWTTHGRASTLANCFRTRVKIAFASPKNCYSVCSILFLGFPQYFSTNNTANKRK